MSLEFTISEEAKSRGISRIAKENNTFCVEVNENCLRFSIYHDDFDKTIRSLNKNTNDAEEDIKQYLKVFVSRNWNELTDTDTKNVNEKENQSQIQRQDGNCKTEIKYDLSYLDWRLGLIERYYKLKNTVDKNLPDLWPSLEFELSVNKILNIKDCTLPFAGFVLGAPSSLKTIGIGLFRQSKNTFYTDNFTPKSFVSNSTAVKREDLENIDLLPKMKDKFFLTPELAPIFGKKDEDLVETLCIITRIVDGEGYENDTGAHGHRGHIGEYMFTWVGAAVDIPRKVHKLLGTLGPKLYFFRLSTTKKTEEEYLDEINKDDFKKKLGLIRVVLLDYLEWFDLCPKATIKNNLVKVEWDSNKDDEVALRIIIRLSILLAHLRGVAPTWKTDSTGIDYQHAMATIEDPSRAMTQLKNLARGHALLQGQNYITIEDLLIVVKVVLSTASKERVKVFELLLSHNGSLTTSEIQYSLNVTAPTARQTMEEFKALNLVDVAESEFTNSEKRMILKDEFDWFLTRDFEMIKQGKFPMQVYVPKNIELLKEKTPPSHAFFLNQPLSVSVYDLRYLK